MADDAVVNSGSGLTVGADERTINSVAVKVQRVVVEGGSDFVTGQVTPTATAATLVAARETRKNVVFFNGTNLDVFVGPATVTTANGFKMPPGSGLTITTTKLVQNIVASVTGLTGVMYYVEAFDA